MVKKATFFNIVFSTILVLSFGALHAQTLPVGMPVLEDYYRRQQLLGKVDSNLSFSIRPLHGIKSVEGADVFDPENALGNDNRARVDIITFAKGKGIFKLLPLSWQQQFNSDHPYGWNDGLMIQAKGYQTMVSGGFFLKYGPLSIQFRPEYVYAVNPAFQSYADGRTNADLEAYYSYHNYIDNPERYGTSAFSRASLGQSSIRLTFGAVSFGLSNENLWWGPGIRNALILSNNAPGFKHFTINTVKPVNTFLGTFEGQLIGARLNNSNLSPLSVTQNSNGVNLLLSTRNESRYYTGVNISYHPKWVPGLFLGFIRSFDSYSSDIHSLGDYLPFLIPYTKQSINANGAQGDLFPRDQVTSIYTRWLFPKAHAEVYFEYGLNDNSYNLTDFLGSPQHSRAYIAGFRKLVPLNDRSGGAILLSGEITQLSQTVDRYLRDSGGWYVHGDVRQGMTNDGQVIGAGTGSGGNLQSTDISWVKGLKKLGMSFERYEHDVDFSNVFFTPINSHSRKWVDFAFGLQGDWDYKNLLINAKLQGVESLNYQWRLANYSESPGYVPNNSVFNLHAELGLTYRF